jgi:adenylate kinase family enzyme
MRVAVIGNSGSGKSTLARELVAVHGVSALDLDTTRRDRSDRLTANTCEV